MENENHSLKEKNNDLKLIVGQIHQNKVIPQLSFSKLSIFSFEGNGHIERVNV